MKNNVWNSIKNRFAKWRSNKEKAVQYESALHKESGNHTYGKQKIHLFRSVGGKIFLTFFIVIVVFVLLVGEISYRISEGVIKDKVADQSSQTMIMASEKLDMVYEKYESLTYQFITNRSLNEEMNKMVNEELTTYELFELKSSFEEKLNAFVFGDDNIIGLYVFDTNGSVVVSAGTPAAEQDHSGDQWVAKTIAEEGRVYWVSTGEDHISSSDKESIGITRQIKNIMNNRVVGLLYIEVNLDVIATQLDSIDMGEQGESLVIDDSNQMIYANDESRIGKTWSTELSQSEDLENSNDYFTTEDENGDERLIVYDPSGINNWTVVGTQLTEDLVKDAKQIQNWAYMLAGIAAIFAVLIGLVMARRIGGPMRRLADLMRKGEQGNLAVRTDFKSKDEIGQLGQSFNQMMSQITLLVQQTNQSAQQVLQTSLQLTDVSKQTAMSAKEISVATEEIAGGATTLAGEAERGTELTQDISQQMERVVQSNMEMGKSANEVRKSSEQGTEYMSFVIEKTNETEQMTRSMVDKVDKLKESTSSIRKILDLLNNITKQTNILSLNATIEAARAGAAGKGFMVVADEIRKLADQSKESIDIVGQITETIQNEIDQTVDVLSEAYPIFQEQTKSVKEADSIFHRVQNQMGEFIVHLDDVTSSVQQLEESQQVLSDAMSSVSAVSEEASATSEEVASLTTEQLKVSDGLVQLSTELESLSTSLQESLSRFKVEE